jgi:hypothetical protein
MTRKDYQLIASVLANFIGDTGDVIDRDGVAYALATALAEDNPRFDRNKFLIAAGVLTNRLLDWSNEYQAKEAKAFTPCTTCGEPMRYVTSQGEWCEAHLPEWAKNIKSQISVVA